MDPKSADYRTQQLLASASLLFFQHLSVHCRDIEGVPIAENCHVPCVLMVRLGGVTGHDFACLQQSVFRRRYDLSLDRPGCRAMAHFYSYCCMRWGRHDYYGLVALPFRSRTVQAQHLGFTWRAERAWLAGSFGFFFYYRICPSRKRGLSSRSEKRRAEKGPFQLSSRELKWDDYDYDYDYDCECYQR